MSDTKPRVSDKYIDRLIKTTENAIPGEVYWDMRETALDLRDARATIAQQAEEIERRKATEDFISGHNSKLAEANENMLRNIRELQAELATTRKRALEEAAEVADCVADERDATAMGWADDSAVMLARAGEATAKRIAKILRAFINGADQ